MAFWLLGCPSGEPAPPPSGGPLLPDVASTGTSAAPHFTHLTLEVEGRTTSLERRDPGWWLTSPVVFPADPIAVDELLSALRRGALREQIAGSPDAAALRELGLAPPRLRLEAAVRGGPTQVLEAGLERPFDGSIPVRRGGETEVHAGSGHLRRVLERDADALRAKRLFPFRPEEVTRLSVRSPGASWTLVQEKQGWMQTETPAFEADPERVLHLLRRLVAIQARSFAEDDAGEREARGLSEPSWVIGLQAGSGATTRVEFSSRPAGPERTLWVRWQIPEAHPTLAQVDARLLTLAATGPDALRSTRLLRFDADAVGGVELDYPDGSTVRLVRVTEDASGGAPRWTAARDDARAEVSPHRVAALLWNLAQLRAQSPRDPGVDPLRPPAEGLHSLRLLDDAGGLLGRVEFGGADPGHGTHVAVRTDALEAFAAGEPVRALRQATRPAAFGLGQGEDGADGASSPKKDP